MKIETVNLEKNMKKKTKYPKSTHLWIFSKATTGTKKTPKTKNSTAQYTEGARNQRYKNKCELKREKPKCVKRIHKWANILIFCFCFIFIFVRFMLSEMFII